MTDKQLILEGLNEEQKKPARHIHGPLYIVAAPGSGKTQTTIRRVAYMIASGVDPEDILMFTFTRKAADEIVTRLGNYVGKDACKVTVGTYHSICSRILRWHGHLIGYSNNFTIYDEQDKKNLLKKIIDKNMFSVPQVVGAISALKTLGLRPKEAVKQAENTFQSTIAGYYTTYQKELVKCGAMDFDDLLMQCIHLLRTQPDVQNQLHKKYKYIMVDEFQDSSASDIEFIELMTGPKQNLCVVFDDEQSIFGFRGSNIDAVLSAIENKYPFTKYILSQNYRSTQTIVDASRNIITYNKNQVPKTVFTENMKGDPVILYEENTDLDEANRVVKIVKGLVRNGQIEYNDIAVLYRMSFLSRMVEETFLKNGIPYEIISGNPFYARREVKDMLSYVKLVNNPLDRESFIRALSSPKRGFGEKSIEKILTLQKPGETLIDAAKSIVLKGKTKKILEQFLTIIDFLQKHCSDNADPAGLVRETIRMTKYEAYLYEHDEDAEDRVSNLIELINIAAEYDSLDDFLSNLTLNHLTEEEKAGGVKLVTMHSSKGLEYPAVIIVGANEGITPHRLAETTPKMEEERRLFYVAMTRAERYLFLTRSKRSMVQGKSIRTMPSRFITEIQDKNLYRFNPNKGGNRKLP